MERGKRISDGELVADLMRHPGMRVLRSRIADRIRQIRSNWYRATNAEEAEYMRKEARNIEAFFNMAKLVILQGKQAEAIAADPSTDSGTRS